MARRIVDETGAANFIDPSERKRKPATFGPQDELTGSVLESKTEDLYGAARPGPKLSLFAENQPLPQRKAVRRPKPSAPPIPKIPIATDFENPIDGGTTPDLSKDPFLNPDFIRNLGRPAPTPTVIERPSLTPSQFGALGGAPQDFGALQEKLRALPPTAGQPPPVRPAGVDLGEIARDVADVTDAGGAFNPTMWGGAAALGALGGVGLNALGSAGEAAPNLFARPPITGSPLGQSAGEVTQNIRPPAGPATVGSAGGNVLRSLDTAAGSALRNPRVLFPALAAMGGFGIGAGSELGSRGGASAALAASPPAISQPYATPTPPPNVVPSADASLDQYDIAQGLAIQDGIDLASAPDTVVERYLKEALDIQQPSGGLRGSVLSGAEGLDKLLRGR